MKLTQKQKVFDDYYIETGNAKKQLLKLDIVKNRNIYFIITFFNHNISEYLYTIIRSNYKWTSNYNGQVINKFNIKNNDYRLIRGN